jgi:hypothetical protein
MGRLNPNSAVNALLPRTGAGQLGIDGRDSADRVQVREIVVREDFG